MRIKPEEGLDVIVSGKLTTFAGSSKYQIVIDTLEPAGVGALMKLLEERKKKLAAEGLFDEARKQLLPFLPRVIGVVTSPTGAVIRDILHRLADRFPRRVLVWPVRVQGESSAAEVANAIEGFNTLPEHGPLPRPDLIIVARGGGSLEDLWSFNEEIVVRAAADSMIPLISAVGHETDVTLIDFAADRRAPTPTAAAAEMARCRCAELLVRIDSLARRSLASWQRAQEARRTELRAAIRALPGADELFALARQRLDHVTARLPRALIANTQIDRVKFSRIAGRIEPRLLSALVERRRERLDHMQGRLATALRSYRDARLSSLTRDRERVHAFGERALRAIRNLIDNRDLRTERASQLLTALSYRGVLERGFALVRGTDGAPLRRAAAVQSGQALEIEFADGRARATAQGAPSIAPVPPPRRRRRGGGEGQGNLFDP
jgi:exodeoxyribonuclease VII large subunit